MPIHLHSHIPPPGIWSRLTRFFRHLLGFTILLLGLTVVALAISVVLVFLSMASFETMRDVWAANVGRTRAEVWSIIFLSVIGLMLAPLLIKWGLRIMQGRRRIVLFLRRFGFEGAYRVVSYAVGAAVGRNMRLATLDDGHAPAMGVPTGARRIYGFTRWISLLILVGGIALLWYVLSVFLPDAWEQQLKGGLGAFFFILIALYSIYFGVLIIALVGTTSLFLWTSRLAITRAEYAKARKITQQDNINRTLIRQIKRMKWIFAPRLVVLKVADEIWQQVVLQMYARTHMVLIDITIPSQHLLWDIFYERILDYGSFGSFQNNR